MLTYTMTHTPIESRRPYITRTVTVAADSPLQAVRMALASLMGAILATVDPNVVRTLLDDLWVQEHLSSGLRYVTTPPLADVLT